MARSAWDIPLTLEDPSTGRVQTVGTAGQAKDALRDFWPKRRGSQFRRAEKACDDALRGGGGGDAARRTFIAAAVEARFLIC